MKSHETASDEQTRGIDEINAAVSKMDEVTQHNAALVEETTAAPRSLKEKGEQLAQAASIFQLDVAPAAKACEQDASGSAISKKNPSHPGVNLPSRNQEHRIRIAK